MHVLDTAPNDLALPVVVAVHGIPEHSEAWQSVAASLADVARVIVPDLPGFGASEKPASLDYSLPSLSRYVEAAVEQLVPGRPIHLVVHDIGGPTGLLWALREPKRITSLVVLNTALLDHHFRPPAAAVLAAVPWLGPRLVARGLADRHRLAAAIRAGAGRPISDQLIEQILAPLSTPDARRAAACVWASYRSSLPALWHARRRLADLRMPAIVLFGERDRYCRPACGRSLADRLPNAKLELLPDCGHFLPAEAPDEVASAVRRLVDAS
jgi:haloalkane dehalogenase